ncbi:MAG: hypothetical protein ABI874_02760 [Chloroflexota bacterium]
MSARGWMVALIGFGAACMFLIGLVFAGGLFLITQQKPAAIVYPTWQDPTKADKLKIDPVLSIAGLAVSPSAARDTNDLTVTSAMLTRGEVDSAFVAAIYATNLSDRQRLAQLQTVGERYAAAEKTAQAKLTYQAVMDIVALSPSLSDFERTEALAQAATSLYNVKERNLAGLALDNGRDIALQSPFLKDASRVVLLGKLLRAAQQGDDSTRIKKLNTDRSNFVDTDPNPTAPAEPPDPLPAIDAPPKNDAVTTAQNKRMAVAQKIAQLADSGAQIPDELISQLSDALFAEDDQRARVYNAPTPQLTLAQKVALARSQVDWLTIKYRVARKAYGVSVVADWEDAVSDLQSDLAKAYEKLTLLRTEQTVGLPKTNDIDLAQMNLVRRQLLAGRLGLYPNFPEDDLVEQLNNLTDKLIGSQPNATLRLKVEKNVDHYFYHLVNDDVWNGQEAQATPTTKPSRAGTPTRKPTTPQATTSATQPAAPNTTPAPQNTPTRPAVATNSPLATQQPTNTPQPAQPSPTNTPPPAPPTNTPVPPPTNTPTLPPPGPTPTRRPYP